MDVTGIVLAATAAPQSGPLTDAVTALTDAGCREVIVVLGDRADAVAKSVPRGALAVVATDWEVGTSAPVKVGLAAAATSSADAVLMTDVDAPVHSAAAARHVIEAGQAEPRGTLARAHYGAKPGYPVLVGRNHWGELAESIHGDESVDTYLSSHLTVEVDCSQLGGN